MRRSVKVLLLIALVGSGLVVNTVARATRAHNIAPTDDTETVFEAMTTLTYSVSVSPPPHANEQITVNFATADGTATAADNDYETTSGTLMFDTGESEATFPITINQDSKFEANENFFVNLSNPQCLAGPTFLPPCAGSAADGPTITDNQGTVTILNEDAAPTLSINDVAVGEGDVGQTPAKFTITRTGETAFATTVQFATANNTAVAPGDYDATSGTVTIPAGGATGTAEVNVQVNGDTVSESDEKFLVNLSNPTNATIATGNPDGTGEGTITNDDGMPPAQPIKINDASANEGDTVTFTVTLEGTPCAGMVTVKYDTRDPATQLGAGTATEGADYPRTTGSVTFNSPAETSKTISVVTTEDAVDESNETFSVFLGDLTTNGTCTTAGVADGEGVGTINDDDPTPGQVNISDASANEGETVGFTVTLSVACPSGTSATIPFSTRNSSGQPVGTATEGTDYPFTSGSVTFVPNDSSETIAVPTTEDAADEPNETFTVFLGTPTGSCPVTVVDGQGEGTIVDDDVPPPAKQVSVNDAQANEGDQVQFTVTLSSPCGDQTMTVPFSTRNAQGQPTGTATEGSDYPLTNGSVQFTGASTARSIVVPTNEDLDEEPDETFGVFLGTPTGTCAGSIADGQGQGTILNDDAAAVNEISINDMTVKEGNSGDSFCILTVTLERATGGAVMVDYATADGRAKADKDYRSKSGMVSFTGNETQQTIAFNVIGDRKNERGRRETFFVNLSNPQNAVLADDQGSCTIKEERRG